MLVIISSSLFFPF